MSLTTGKIFTILRNYLILAVVVMYVSIGLAETFTHPNRLRKQQRLDDYGRYITAGLVSTLQQIVR